MLGFKNYHRLVKVPFIVYADFECHIKPIQSCDPNPKTRDGIERSYTKQYQKHEPSSFCYHIKCFDDGVYEPKLVSYMGDDAAQKFVVMLEEDIREFTSISEKKMIFGKEEEKKKKKKRFDKETKCWICNGEFKDDVKNGRYRGAAHNLCNLKYRKPNFTPVVFHNRSGYDSHLFVKISVVVMGVLIVFPKTKKGILASPKKYWLGVIRRK